jgi:hypothetical protein
MEAVGAGASVLAFVGVALQGTKSLYNAIASYKNATKETAALVSAVGNLQIILTQLRDCTALANRTSTYKMSQVFLTPVPET